MKLFDYEHIIWDWNGTLFDDAALTLSIMNGMLERRGLAKMTPEFYAEVFDFPVRDYYEKIGWDLSVHKFEDLSDEFVEEYYSRNQDYPMREGAEKILRSNPVPQSILTASKQTDIDTLITHFGLEGLFTGVKGLNDHHAAGKLEVGIRWVQELGVVTQNILMVGDTTHDAALAKELGMNCVLIERGHQSRDRLEKCGVKIIDHLQELI